MKLRTIAFAMAAALLSTLLLGPYAAAHSGASASPFSAIPVTGMSADGGTFTGTFTIRGFSKKDGQLAAVGKINGMLTYTGADPRAVANVPARVPVTSVSASGGSHGLSASEPGTLQPQQASEPGTLQPQQAPGSCLVHLEFGGITLDIAGIQLVISAFTLDLTLTGLLGQILCGLLGVLGGAPPPAQANILNQALGLNR